MMLSKNVIDLVNRNAVQLCTRMPVVEAITDGLN